MAAHQVHLSAAFGAVQPRKLGVQRGDGLGRGLLRHHRRQPRQGRILALEFPGDEGVPPGVCALFPVQHDYKSQTEVFYDAFELLKEKHNSSPQISHRRKHVLKGFNHFQHHGAVR